MSLPQPFLDGMPGPLPKKKEIAKLRSWMSGQPHLPTISDEYLLLFLHACYYSQERARACVEAYFTIRSSNPEIFGDRDLFSDSIQGLLKLAQMAKMPQLTPEGYRILVYRLADPDYRKLVFSEGVKAFCMVNDVILSDDRLTEGYVIIFDMKGIALGHLARVSLPALRVFMQYIQEAHPVRLKSIHVLHTASFISHVMRLLMPLIKNDLLGLIKFHTGSIVPGLDMDLLPSDLGGKQPKLEDLHREQYELMMEKYHKWLLQTEELKVDESKRPKKASWLSLFTGTGVGSKETPTGFKALEDID